MRIGILTFHRAHNCGAMLQAWALKKTLERMGHTVEFPACNHVGESPRFRPWVSDSAMGVMRKIRSIAYRLLVNLLSIPCEDVLQHRYRRFRSKFLSERACEPTNFGQHYDILISGSDQVFSEAHAGDSTPLFFCENKPKSLRAIAYAASYGDQPLKDECLSRVVKALDNFSAVSVRETLAKDQLASKTRKKIVETLDPTLLVTSDDYEEIARGKIPSKPYLFMYTLSTEPFFLDTARELSRRLGVKCVIAPCYQYTRWKAPKGITYSVSPDRLVQYARHADYILAGSFHGTVMGIAFRKPFLSLRGQVDVYESRPAALLRKLGCLDRIVNPETSIDEMEHILRQSVPDYSEKLQIERARSIEWLRESIS